MPDVSRRAFVATGAGVAGLVLLDQTAATAQTQLVRDGGGGPLRSDYSDAVGTVFTLRGRRHGAVRARLRSIEDVPGVPSADAELCFVLVFEPLGGRRIPDAIWSVDRRGARSHDLALSSVGRAGAVQAVIDRRTA